MTTLRADYLTSPMLSKAGFRHAFFTRSGGVSEGKYASLNFSFAVGDDPERVSRNLRRAGETLEVAPEQLFFASQVHGDGVLEVYGQEEHEAVLHTDADAIVSSSSALACCVRTADCVPILAADQSTGRVVAIHAGWRGLVAGVIGNSLRGLGGDPASWLAAIGPHISATCFEISEEVAVELEGSCAAQGAILRAVGKKPHAALGAIAAAQLKQSGINAEAIDTIEGCTQADAARFFSFRRDGRYSGRHLSGIVAQRP